MDQPFQRLLTATEKAWRAR